MVKQLFHGRRSKTVVCALGRVMDILRLEGGKPKTILLEYHAGVSLMARLYMPIAGHFEPLFSLARSIRLAFLLNFGLAGVKQLLTKFFDVRIWWWEVGNANSVYGHTGVCRSSA